MPNRKPKGKRVTPKGTQPGATRAKGTAARSRPAPQAPSAGGRYTPPIPREQRVSPTWVPVLMFGLLGLGTVLIIVNYLGVLPGGQDNRYLLLGLALITGGFVTATQYH